MKLAAVALCAALLAPLAAQADGRAVIQGADGRTYAVEFDARHLRLEDRQRSGMHVLSRDGVLYAVTSAAGQPIVVSGDAVIGLLNRGGRQAATGDQDIQKLVSLKPAGKVHTIAGVQGTDYLLTYRDRAGRTRTETVVLSDDPDLQLLTRRFGQAVLDFQQRAGVDTQGARELLAELDRQGKGLLAFGQHFRLSSLERTAPAAERFALPGAVLQLPPISDLQSLIPGLGRAR